MVLLSLAIYAFIELKLRDRLAQTFNASIAANKPKPNTGNMYRHKEEDILAMLLNLAFGLLAFFHLVYLGSMIGRKWRIPENGNSLKYIVGKWKSLNFMSHRVAFFEIVVTFLAYDYDLLYTVAITLTICKYYMRVIDMIGNVISSLF